MNLLRSSWRFENAGYYFFGLVLLAILGFWPSYFSTFFDGTADFNFYFHFHALIVGLWVALLIMQPILIRRKQVWWHRTAGKLSYVIFPLIFISVLLLAHSRHTLEEQDLGRRLFVPLKDLIVLAVAYFIAIRYRRDTPIHARAMIATGIVFIEPALIRLIRNAVLPGPGAYLLTIGIVYSILITLMILERHQKRGRWVFPLVLGLLIVVHSIIISSSHIQTWVPRGYIVVHSSSPGTGLTIDLDGTNLSLPVVGGRQALQSAFGK